MLMDDGSDQRITGTIDMGVRGDNSVKRIGTYKRDVRPATRITRQSKLAIPRAVKMVSPLSFLLSRPRSELSR